jgi:hypothetical protein
MTTAYINRIATAVTPNNVHAGFVRLAETQLPEAPRQRTIFAHTLMRPGSAALAVTLPRRFPAVLTFCAGLSGKTRQVPLATPPRA